MSGRKKKKTYMSALCTIYGTVFRFSMNALVGKQQLADSSLDSVSRCDWTVGAIGSVLGNVLL